MEEASPNRVVPRCRHADACGGCAWQHIAYPEQLRKKTALLDVLLRKSMGKGAPRVLPTIGMPVGGDGMPWRFRQKAAFVFGRGPGGLVMGHFARGTNDVVAVEECPVHAGRANRIAFALRDALRAACVPAAGVGTDGLARHVVVRTSRDEKEAVAMLVATRDDPALQTPLRALLDGAEKPEGLVLNLHDRPGPWLVGRESKRVAGTGHVQEEALGPAFLVSPASFFQTNVAAAATLVRLVAEALPGETGLRVLDLYSGGGLFALPLALRGHSVTAVEESRKSARDAELNRRQNGVSESRLKLVCSSVEKALPYLKAGAFDAVVLDPPREGCPPEVIREVFGRLQARPRHPRLLRPRGPRARAAARRGGRLPRGARPAGGHVSPHAAHGVGHRLGALDPQGGVCGSESRSRRQVAARPHATYTVFTFTNSRIPNAPTAADLTPRTPSSRSRTPGSRTPPAPGRSRTPGSRRTAGGDRTSRKR